MVTDEGRNNIIATAVIIGFSLMLIAFIYTFVGNMERSTDEVGDQVRRGVVNVTTSQAIQTESIINLTETTNNMLAQLVKDRQATQANIALFMGAFRNQTNEMVDTINQMSRDNNVTTAEQTEAFVTTLQKQMNLTDISQNLTQQRITQESLASEKLDNLTRLLNLTLTIDDTKLLDSNSNPNSTTTRSQP